MSKSGIYESYGYFIRKYVCVYVYAYIYIIIIIVFIIISDSIQPLKGLLFPCNLKLLPLLNNNALYS